MIRLSIAVSLLLTSFLSTPVAIAAPQVSGNTITWPDDGWYQVQRSDDYSTVCEGVRQCVVEDGTYTVINHTTGSRFPDVRVHRVGNSIAAGQIPVPENARLDESATYLIESLAGYQLEQVQSYTATLGDAVMETALSSETLESSSVPVTANGVEQQLPNQRTEYACPAGGSMIREVAMADLDEPGYSEDAAIDGWRFRQCRIDASSGELLAGVHLVDGFVSRAGSIASGNRFNTVKQAVGYASFSLDAPGNNRLFIDASATVEINNSHDTGSTRSIVMNQYTEVRGGSILRDIRDAQFQFFISDEGGGAFQVLSASMQGRIQGSVTGGADVSINTDETLERTSVTSEDLPPARVPFKGQLQMSAADGDQMSIIGRAGAPDFNAPLLYDYTLLTADGESFGGEGQTLPAFAIFAPENAFFQ